MDIVDDELERIGRRFELIQYGVLTIYYVTPVLLVLYFFHDGGLMRFLTTCAGLIIWTAASQQLFEHRARGRYITDRSPNEIIEEYEDAIHPMTAILASRADRIARPATDDEAKAVVLEGTNLGVFSWEQCAKNVRVNDNMIRVEIEEGLVTGIVEVSIDGGTTWVDIAVDRQKVSALTLLIEWFASSVERRLHEYFRIQRVRRSSRIGFRSL